MLEDEFLPTYDVSDAVAVVVDADAATAWAALMEVDLIELGRHRPLVGVLGALRLLPEIIGHLLHGEPPPAAPKCMRLRDTVAIPASAGGWSLLGEGPDQELALGLVGRFWRPVIEYAEVAPEDFRDFSEPGWAKTVYALSAPRWRTDRGRCCPGSCVRRPPMTTRAAGSSATGPSASARAPTCS